ALSAGAGDLYYILALQENNACSHQSCYTAVLCNPLRSKHPRPNPSFLSTVASRHCLGVLSEGMRGAKEEKSKKRAKQIDKHRKTRRQKERLQADSYSGTPMRVPDETLRGEGMVGEGYKARSLPGLESSRRMHA
ncbi:putative membrane protein NMB1645, partial [Dissostichus eleginoides]